MSVELIRNKYPLSCRRGRNYLCEMTHKVRLCPSRAQARGNLFSGGDFEIGRQTLRAMANVFVFLSFVLACLACHTFTNGAGEVTPSLLNIGKVAPGIFAAADSSSQGWAAAAVVYVKSY